MNIIRKHSNFKQFISSCHYLALMAISAALFSVESFAKPKFKSHFGFNIHGFARIQVKNETTKDLACWVAIDGHKKKFRLPALTMSQWYTATDKRYNYQNFSTWCDYIDLHPEYQKYNRG